jgi:Glycosyl hydrolase family 115
MSLAVDRNATRVWILNVGDLKPYEREIEFFLTLGWNATRLNPDNLESWVSNWAQREFDISSADAGIITSIVGNLTRFNARRKPELQNGTTYSLISYREYVLRYFLLRLSNV